MSMISNIISMAMKFPRVSIYRHRVALLGQLRARNSMLKRAAREAHRDLVLRLDPRVAWRLVGAYGVSTRMKGRRGQGLEHLEHPVIARLASVDLEAWRNLDTGSEWINLFPFFGIFRFSISATMLVHHDISPLFCRSVLSHLLL